MITQETNPVIISIYLTLEPLTVILFNLHFGRTFWKIHYSKKVWNFFTTKQLCSGFIENKSMSMQNSIFNSIIQKDIFLDWLENVTGKCNLSPSCCCYVTAFLPFLFSLAVFSSYVFLLFFEIPFHTEKSALQVCLLQIQAGLQASPWTTPTSPSSEAKAGRCRARWPDTRGSVSSP